MKLEVCLTPELVHQHELKGKIAVVVDIFRATSCMVAGLSVGVSDIYPVSEVETCLEMGKRGMITAGERGGKKIPQFDIGNSPFEYMNPAFKGKSICVTTTNGTHAIEKSKSADIVLVASFLNLSATANYLHDSDKDVIILCAGWKGTPNLEDTLFAGALIENCTDHEKTGDSSLLAYALYQNNKKDLLSVARESSHARRLSGFGINTDIEFCMKTDEFDEVMILKEDRIVRI